MKIPLGFFEVKPSLLVLRNYPKNYFRNGWDMGTKMCDLTGFLLTMFGMAAINNLTGICLFRYYVFTSDRVKNRVIFMEDCIPIRTDRSLLLGRLTPKWSLWDVVIHENNPRS